MRQRTVPLRTLLISASLLGALLLSVAPAAQAQRGASDYLEARHNEVTALLRTSAETPAAQSQRSTRLATLLSGFLDFESISEQALGAHWESSTPEARELFVGLLRRLVERNYENNMEHTLEFEISYEGEARRGATTLVRTQARSRTQRRQPPVAINYAMRRQGRAWRVVDVTTDGVSMVGNYRSQFHRIIESDGWDALIERMQTRLGDES